MFDNFVFIVAYRYFRAKKNERFVSIISGFSLLGVTIGVAALVVVVSVMKGFHREFIRNVIGLNGDISVMSKNRVITDYMEVETQLMSKDYITHITKSVVGQALAVGNRESNGVLIKGISKHDLRYRGEILNNTTSGKFDEFEGKNVAAIGTELSYSLGAKVGSNIKLISTNIISTAFGSMPRSKEFKVIAIFSSGMHDYDSSVVLMPLEAAQSFLSCYNGINLFEININDSDNVNYCTKDIQHSISADLRASNWQQTNSQFLNALAVEQVAMFTILSLIVVVAAFNIISSLFMLVKDKTKDIAILRTMGATQKQIMLIFIYNGMFIGLIGTISGIIMGTSFALNIDSIRKYLESLTGSKIFDAVIYFLYTLPSEVKVGDVLLIATLSIILCLLATIYPAYKASKMNPVDMFRYE
ncbi:MAG: lipoprotein-releasing ABC transporter permease subunit [Rickettsiaceae bacterium]|nr:MAG: lipoprotein-releasing ABC transporter permease subunit [Rickettsiaceae bacterium]